MRDFCAHLASRGCETPAPKELAWVARPLLSRLHESACKNSHETYLSQHRGGKASRPYWSYRASSRGCRSPAPLLRVQARPLRPKSSQGLRNLRTPTRNKVFREICVDISKNSHAMPYWSCRASPRGCRRPAILLVCRGCETPAPKELAWVARPPLSYLKWTFCLRFAQRSARIRLQDFPEVLLVTTPGWPGLATILVLSVIFQGLQKPWAPAGYAGETLAPKELAGFARLLRP